MCSTDELFALATTPAEANDLYKELYAERAAELGKPCLTFAENLDLSEGLRKWFEVQKVAREKAEKAAAEAAERANKLYTCRTCEGEFTQPEGHTGRAFVKCDACRTAPPKAKADKPAKAVKPKADKPATNHARKCVKCGKGFTTPARRGRPATKCEACR